MYLVYLEKNIIKHFSTPVLKLPNCWTPNGLQTSCPNNFPGNCHKPIGANTCKGILQRWFDAWPPLKIDMVSLGYPCLNIWVLHIYMATNILHEPPPKVPLVNVSFILFHQINEFEIIWYHIKVHNHILICTIQYTYTTPFTQYLKGVQFKTILW